MTERNPIVFRLWNAVIRTTVIVVGLLILWLVFMRLPMLQEMTPVSVLPTRTLGELLALAALTALFIILLLFGREVAYLARSLSATAATWGDMVNYLLALGVIILAYYTYFDLVTTQPFLISKEWIYSVVFLVLGLLPLVGIVLVISNNLQNITTWAVRASSGGTPKTVPCPTCQSPVRVGAAFCARCGGRMAPVAPPVPAGGTSCAKCGRPLSPGAKFCFNCGSPVTAAPSMGVAPAGPVGAPAGPRCAGCGAPLSEGAKFCRTCGHAVTAAPASVFTVDDISITPPPTTSTASAPVASPTAATVTAPPTATTCPGCGAPIRATAKFCGSCGKPITTTGAN